MVIKGFAVYITSFDQFTDSDFVKSFFSWLAGADAFLNPPGSYALSICGNDRAWLERDKLNFLKNRGAKKNEGSGMNE